MMLLELVCILTLGTIAIGQIFHLRSVQLRLWDSTALLLATVKVVEMDNESKRLFIRQIEENKIWM